MQIQHMATVIVLNIKNKQTLSLMSQIPNKSMAYEKATRLNHNHFLSLGALSLRLSAGGTQAKDLDSLLSIWSSVNPQLLNPSESLTSVIC